jgi:signal transduction histidine kinase
VLEMDYGFHRPYVERAYTVALLMRHSTNVLAATVTLADPASTAKPPGKWMVAALGCWAVYRLTTRSHRNVFAAIDFAFTLAICAAIPVVTNDSELVLYWSAPEAIAATAIVSFAASLPVRVSLPMTALIVVTYAAGAASVVGWASTLAMVSLRYFVIQAAMSALVRGALLRVSAAIDRAHDSQPQAAELKRRVAEAVKSYEREQFALLHDTAASTLLMVGKETPISPDRLAAQARRDLAVLNSRPSTLTQRIELIAALRERASGTRTPLRFHGPPAVWLEDNLGRAVVAAAGEAMTNVDRHAGATEISVEVCQHSVVVADNGCGFVPTPSTTGRGIAESIVGRMQRVGATAHIHSVPGGGTAVELSWADTAQCGRTPEKGTDPDHLIERVRIGYGYTLISVALLIVVLTVPFTLTHDLYPAAQIGLAALAALSCLAALPTLNITHGKLRWLAVTALFVLTVVQPALLPPSLLGSTAQWSLVTVGWCLSALLLGLPLGTAIAILGANWVVACAVTLAREPSARILVSLGFLGSYVVVMQAFAQVANAMIMHAASATHAETQARLELLTRQRVAAALQAEYRQRYADLTRSVIPLLTKLSRGRPVDAGLRQQARAESQRIRTLLDRASAFDHPLLHALRPTVDAATNRNVEVDVQVHSKLPDLGQADIEQLTEAISHILDKCKVGARLVLTTASKELIVSVVGRGHTSGPDDEEPTVGIGTHEVVTLNGTTWLTIRHPLPTAGSDDILTYDHAV